MSSQKDTKKDKEERRARRAERRALRKEEKKLRKLNKKRGRSNMFYDDYMSAFYGDDYVTPNRGGYSRHLEVVTPTAKTTTAASTVMTPETQALIRQMLSKQARTFSSYEDALADENPVPDSYFPGATGWMVLQRRSIDGNEMQFVTTATKNPLVSDVPKSSTINIVNRIPKELLVEIVGSFARICKASGNEAAAQIYRERDGERKYIVYYPEQKISGAQVSYADDPGMIDMRASHDLIMELHSHNTMGAFWSGTDNTNEKDCGLYMVIGTFGAASATYKCRYKYGLIYQDFPAHQIFDMTPEEEAELLKRENWTEGNPIIDQKAKAHVYTYGRSAGVSIYNKDYNFGSRTAATPSSGYKYLNSYADGVRNSGKLPAAIKTEYDKYAEQVITYATNYDLARSLWAYAKVNAENKYECENHVYTNNPETNMYAWIPITVANRINPFLEKVKTYVDKFAKEWNEHTILTTQPPAANTTPDGYRAGTYGYNTSPAAVVDMLIGASEDTQARQVFLPSKYKEYQNMDVPDYKPGINDNNFIQAVELQAIARVTANEHVEAAYNNIVNRDAGEVYVPMTEDDFRKRMLERIIGESFETNFDPTIMWELFTSVDKSRIARTLGVTVVELSAMFGKLAGSSLCYPFVVFLYWSLMVDDTYRAHLIAFVEQQYAEMAVPEENIKEVNLLARLNEVFKANPDIAIDITRPVNAIPCKVAANRDKTNPENETSPAPADEPTSVDEPADVDETIIDSNNQTAKEEDPNGSN